METNDSPIIDLGLDDVVRFCCTSKKLTIQRESRRDIEIIFNPNFMLKFIQI